MGYAFIIWEPSETVESWLKRLRRYVGSPDALTLRSLQHIFNDSTVNHHDKELTHLRLSLGVFANHRCHRRGFFSHPVDSDPCAAPPSGLHLFTPLLPTDLTGYQTTGSHK